MSPDTGGHDTDHARSDRSRQARAWAIALDPVYGIIAFGLIGFGIDHWQGTYPRWTGILAVAGLIAGFYRFIREAGRLNRENTQKWAGRPFRPVEPEHEPEHEPEQEPGEDSDAHNLPDDGPGRDRQN